MTPCLRARASLKSPSVKFLCLFPFSLAFLSVIIPSDKKPTTYYSQNSVLNSIVLREGA